MLVEWAIDLFDFLLLVVLLFLSNGIFVLYLYTAVNTRFFKSLEHLLPDSIESALNDLEESWQLCYLNIIGSMRQLFEAKRSIIIRFTYSVSWICIECIILNRKSLLLIIFHNQSMVAEISAHFILLFNRCSGSRYLLDLKKGFRSVHIEMLGFILYNRLVNGNERFAQCSCIYSFFLGVLTLLNVVLFQRFTQLLPEIDILDQYLSVHIWSLYQNGE